MKLKPLEEQTIKDDFMFGAVMTNPEICKLLLEHILGVKIRKLVYPELQKTIKHTMNGKSVRLDVYVEDDFHTVYNIEMQTVSSGNLPKRMRYYQGMIDLNIIKQGSDYEQLKKSYIIFICDYDAYGKGRHIYTFENVCLQEPGISFGDETTKIVLNTRGMMDDVSEELKEVLHYIGGAAPASELTRNLESMVEEIRANEKWRREYMNLFLRDKENQRFGKTVHLVEQVRRIDESKIEEAAPYLNADTIYIQKVLAIISEHPDWDDYDVAEELWNNR